MKGKHHTKHADGIAAGYGSTDKRRRDPWGFGLEYLSKSKMCPCLECGVLTMGRHHVVPVAVGGTRQIPLCRDCHKKAHQVHWGRPKTSNDKIERAQELRRLGTSYIEIANQLGIANGTAYNYAKDVRVE